MLLCTKCISAPEFTDWIRQHGHLGQCDFDVGHGAQGRVVTVEDFAVHFDEFFRDHYQLGSEEQYFLDDSDKVAYQQRGSPLFEILSDELSVVDDAVIKAIIENLPDVSHREIQKGAERFYDDLASYENIAEVEALERAEQKEFEEWYRTRFAYQWEEFCQKVQYEQRFFKTKELLDDLFGEPSEYEGFGKLSPIYTLKEGQNIFRARILDGGFTESMLNLNPSKELGAPPKERAPAGRMNVEYIPAFYGSFSEKTAIAEMRPGIGEEIAIGYFTLTRDIKVFDFTVFSSSPINTSNAEYINTRYEFIEHMEEEISRPIMPFNKQREYISTQIVAEYLKEYFGCEAVIYRSSVVRGIAAENRNIVILPRAQGFVGTVAAILEYRRFDVMEVLDVTYKVSPPTIPF
jgi:RES domain